jgi:hypothetical protein
MSKPTKEDNDASLLAVQNLLFNHFMDVIQDQFQAMYAFVDRHGHHLSKSYDNAQPLHTIVTYSSSNPPCLNEPTIQETLYDDAIIITSPNSNIPTIQETPDSDIPTIQETRDGDDIRIIPPYFNALPIQETQDGNEIATSSGRNISPLRSDFRTISVMSSPLIFNLNKLLYVTLFQSKLKRIKQKTALSPSFIAAGDR